MSWRELDAQNGGLKDQTIINTDPDLSKKLDPDPDPHRDYVDPQLRF